MSEDGWYIRVKNTHGPVEEGTGREGKVHLHFKTEWRKKCTDVFSARIHRTELDKVWL